MKKIKGFSLLELISAIVIIVILSAISGPVYKSYTMKVKQAEGYALLGVIRSAQESYYNEFRNYLNNYGSSIKTSSANGRTCNEEVLGIDARPNEYYTAFAVGFSENSSSGNDTSQIGYLYKAIVYGNGASNITMVFNRTSGVTVS